PAGLTHGERQVAVVAVEEPVALVDPAHRLERRAAQAEADAIDDRDLLPRRAHGRALGETVDDRAAGVAAVAADPLDPVQSRGPRAGSRGRCASSPPRRARPSRRWRAAAPRRRSPAPARWARRLMQRGVLALAAVVRLDEAPPLTVLEVLHEAARLLAVGEVR